MAETSSNSALALSSITPEELAFMIKLAAVAHRYNYTAELVEYAIHLRETKQRLQHLYEERHRDETRQRCLENSRRKRREKSAQNPVIQEEKST